jgi:hypothetical protein
LKRFLILAAQDQKAFFQQSFTNPSGGYLDNLKEIRTKNPVAAEFVRNGKKKIPAKLFTIQLTSPMHSLSK